MIIYLLSFFLSYLILISSERVRTKCIRLVMILVALLIPSVLAGLRDYSIGTDISVYGNIWFQNAIQSKDIFTYLKWASSSDIGIVYAILNYIVSVFTTDPHWFYFTLSFITIGFTYKTAIDNKDLVNVPFSMLVYYLLFYNQSLNLLRQSLAMVFVACTFKYLRTKNLGMIGLFSVLAVLTHSSAIIVVAIIATYFSVNSNYKTIAKISIIAASFISVLFLNQLIELLVHLKFLTSRYESYLSVYQRGGGYVRLFLLCIPYLLLMITCNKKNQNVHRSLTYYLIMATFLSFLAFRMTYLSRIAYYFDIFLIITIPFIDMNSNLKIRIKSIELNRIILIIMVFAYWVYVYVYTNSGNTIPYIFS